MEMETTSNTRKATITTALLSGERSPNHWRVRKIANRIRSGIILATLSQIFFAGTHIMAHAANDAALHGAV